MKERLPHFYNLRIKGELLIVQNTEGIFFVRSKPGNRPSLVHEEEDSGPALEIFSPRVIIYFTCKIQRVDSADPEKIEELKRRVLRDLRQCDLNTKHPRTVTTSASETERNKEESYALKCTPLNERGENHACQIQMVRFREFLSGCGQILVRRTGTDRPLPPKLSNIPTVFSTTSREMLTLTVLSVLAMLAVLH